MIRYFKSIFQDRTLFIWAYRLVFTGLLLLFSASKGVHIREGLFLKQCLWLVMGTILAVLVKKMDYRDLQKMAPVLYAVILFFLFLVRRIP